MRRILVENARRKGRIKHGGELRSASNWTSRDLADNLTGRASCWPSTKRSTSWRQDDPSGGRAGQAAILRRVLDHRGRRDPRHVALKCLCAVGLRSGLAAVRSREMRRARLSTAGKNLFAIPGRFRSQRRITLWSEARMVIVMTTEPRKAKDIFVELVSNVAPDRVGRAGSNRLARDDDELRNRVRALLRAHAEPGSFLEQPAGRGTMRPCTTSRRSPSGPGTRHRPLQAAAADRRRRHGRRLHGRADRAGPAHGRAQDHQAGHGHAAGDRPLRGRAAGPGDDGPSEHRQGAGRRHDRQRPAVLRDGAGQGRADHQVLRRQPPAAPRSGWSCSCRSARRSSTPIRRASSTATSSRSNVLVAEYDGQPVPKVIDFGVAKATGAAADRADDVHRASAR